MFNTGVKNELYVRTALQNARHYAYKNSDPVTILKVVKALDEAQIQLTDGHDSEKGEAIQLLNVAKAEAEKLDICKNIVLEKINVAIEYI